MHDERVDKLRAEAARLKSALRHQKEIHRHVADVLRAELEQR